MNVFKFKYMYTKSPKRRAGHFVLSALTPGGGVGGGGYSRNMVNGGARL